MHFYICILIKVKIMQYNLEWTFRSFTVQRNVLSHLYLLSEHRQNIAFMESGNHLHNH